MEIEIRKMIKSDITDFPKAFSLQGWDKPITQYQKYFDKQECGKIKIFVATVDNSIAGYAILLSCDTHGPFKNKNIPTVSDFNVLEKYQRKGIGTAILDSIEEHVKTYSNIICIGVGLHYGYGSAQRMYIKRGYVPDGSGVWYNNERLEQGALCNNDDDLILYLSKQFC